MELNRRTFLKVSGATVAGIALSGIGFRFGRTRAYAAELRTKNATVTTTICPYCAVGCSILVHAIGGNIINTEGDPDHPINQGSLCAKGAALYQLVTTESRIKRPLYRAPYSDKWVEMSWGQALSEIARRVKQSRDSSFTTTNAKGQVVNRTDGIAHVGSAALDNEECWALQTMMRALGLAYIEHQARI